ncbi:MAG: DUF2207 family protein [Clostridia bacterium]
MKNKKILFILVFAIFMLLVLTTKSNASLYLNNLDFYAEIDSNGNMNVTETWNIRVSNTNTLYKTFELDKSKYSNITNVEVSEVGKGNFSKTNTWAYHLTKDYYFGGINSDGDFEIAWGVGLDNSSATKTYKISYTVVDAIAKYNDCAEMYWQFLGNDFEINASKITGTIKLPSKANSKEDIRVWGHVKTLNGEIYVTSNDTVEFSLDNYESGNYVEVRIAMPTGMIETSERIYNKNALSSIIQEEIKWADEANAVRERQQRNEKIISTIIIVVIVVAGILLIIQAIKYIKKLKNTNKLRPTEELEYFREKPNKDSTPADALFLYNNGATVASTSFGNIFSATLLNLSLKGYFKVAVEENEKGKEDTVIYKLEKNIGELQYEEEKIARFVQNAIGGQEKITIKELQKYIKKHPESVSKLIENTGKLTKNKNKITEKFDEQTAKEKSKYTGIAIVYFVIAMFCFGIFFPLSILLIFNAILAILINRKLSNLTQKGIDEKEKWKGLKKYMEDFSLLNEKEIPALEVWEEYLVYATVFGIADKVIKQLKMVYPQIEEMDNFNTASYIYLMSHTNFNSSFSKAINSSISSAMSSGSGRRRWLLWWRRRRPEAGGGGRRKISFKKY